MIRVHHLNNSRSQRVLWLLEELGVPYEITRYQRNKATMLAPDEMKRAPRSANRRSSRMREGRSPRPD
jgi:glutathione S-transferase